MSDAAYRIERDSMGELQVPAGAMWGPQTQRALQNFPASGLRMPRVFIRALGLIKAAAARANHELGDLEQAMAAAIEAGGLEVASGRLDDQFPLDVFQTGSGTSSNMNANEVIAHWVHSHCGICVLANDHVNMAQSSNDAIPTAIHVGASLTIEERLKPALRELSSAIAERAREHASTVKTGRTHLMDAMPLTLGQELGGWQAQIDMDIERLEQSSVRLHALAQGGTAVGTGINARAEFGASFARHLSALTAIDFRTSANYFAALASQDTAVELSGVLKVIAVSLMKISNDLRWMNSGPLAGLAEISLKPLQPGSSIMPGKVNPVVPEAVSMIAVQVIGNDAAITIGGQSGNFQLNVMLPMIAHNLIQSAELLAIAASNLARHAIAEFTVNMAVLSAALDRNPILVTALNPVIGYEKGAAIAKAAYAQKRPIVDVAAEMSGLTREELGRLLDPLDLTRGGIKGGASGGS